MDQEKKVEIENNEPIGCTKEYIEDICIDCEYNQYVLVEHPGGSIYHSVEKHHCEWGHWKEDF